MDIRTYVAIDLKSFYASVECIERKLDPMKTNLVVADAARTEKTICLAVSPTMKAYGIPGRARLFEVNQKVKEENVQRLKKAPHGIFKGSSWDDFELKSSPGLELKYITAPPRMALYVQYSTKIYRIYLKYVAPEDMHVYSIDEVFLDVTNYLNIYRLSARELATKILLDVLDKTGITATAGIGTNLYLCKVAMDIGAKHVSSGKDGVRIAELDEKSYRRTMWSHRPLTDFWRVGRGYTRKLEAHGMYTMGDIARCSIGKPEDFHNEALLYNLFGVNAELLIDHAWGWEPCTISDVKAYKPSNNSLGSGQVLQHPYPSDKAKLIVREMTDLLALDLVDKGLVSNQLVLTVGYDIENLKDPQRRKSYRGEVTTDQYGRAIPKHAHGTISLGTYTSSSRQMLNAISELFDRIVDPTLLIRRVNITAGYVVPETDAPKAAQYEQLNFFTDYRAEQLARDNEAAELAREKRIQKAMLAIKKRYGKNAILKGMNLREGATTKERNDQIGGHRA